LLHHGLAEHPAAERVKERLGSTQCSLIGQMIERGLNTPLTSSAGRLFDAVSALLGVCEEATYEGEPAILLEAALAASVEQDLKAPSDRVRTQQESSLSFPLWQKSSQCTLRSEDHSRKPSVGRLGSRLRGNDSIQDIRVPLPSCSPSPFIIPTRDLLLALLDSMQAGASTAELARFFHEALMQLLVEAASRVREQTGLDVVALSGGVFNNRFIATHMPALLENEGFQVLIHDRLPPNDGCISYGQAAVACAQLKSRAEAATLEPSCV
jgi:hydrogenase maturation protein HypF